MNKASNDKTVVIPDGQVSSMIFLPVAVKAAESEKRNSLLTDHKAVEIYHRISDTDPFLDAPGKGLLHYFIICRTISFDRLIRDFVWRHPTGTVIDIGCGLDSAYERINPQSIKWYDIDLPHIIELRRRFFQESENRKFISSSFLSNDWTGKIIYHEAILIFASGVFYYYNEEVIRKFILKLCTVFPSCELLFDIASASGVRFANRFMHKNGIYSEKVKWVINDFRTVLTWNPRISFLGRYNVFHRSLQIPFWLKIQGLIYDALSINKIVHFKIRYNYNKLSR